MAALTEVGKSNRSNNERTWTDQFAWKIFQMETQQQQKELNSILIILESYTIHNSLDVQ